ncbi:YtxH domain-containing protein [Flavobacterium sp. FBOR7N2.3]|uniref:YtxH domain-containing protein n=1 Tax=Flavobacterium magnesitis TaxID=3138077 RepID=A0ABV4TLX5_9FLAO
MKTNKVILGVIGGLATGAILGVLFAPNSGKNTRKKIADKSKTLKDNTKKDLDKLMQKLDEKYQSVSETANKFLHEGKAKIENEIAKKN